MGPLIIQATAEGRIVDSTFLHLVGVGVAEPNNDMTSLASTGAARRPKGVGTRPRHNCDLTEVVLALKVWAATETKGDG